MNHPTAQVLFRLVHQPHEGNRTVMKDQMTHSRIRLFCPLLLLTVVAGCATESHQAVQTEHTASSTVAYRGVRNSIAVGKFDNRSTYLRGLFSDGVDRL